MLVATKSSSLILYISGLIKLDVSNVISLKTYSFLLTARPTPTPCSLAPTLCKDLGLGFLPFPCVSQVPRLGTGLNEIHLLPFLLPLACDYT